MSFPEEPYSTETFFDPVIEEKAGKDLDYSCTRDTQTDIKQSAACPAHPPRHRDSDQKSSSDPLNHNKFCFSEPIEEANEAEQEAGQQTIRGHSDL